MIFSFRYSPLEGLKNMDVKKRPVEKGGDRPAVSACMKTGPAVIEWAAIVYSYPKALLQNIGNAANHLPVIIRF